MGGNLVTGLMVLNTPCHSFILLSVVLYVRLFMGGNLVIGLMVLNAPCHSFILLSVVLYVRLCAF